MIERRIVDHYWNVAMRHESIVVFDGESLRHEFYLTQIDFSLFPELRGAVCLILWEENGEVKCELDLE